MATAVLLSFCWLVHVGISHSHSYFYPDCESMNCSRILQMPRNLDTIQQSLDSIKQLEETLCGIMDKAIEGVHFDDLRIQLLLITSAADDSQNGKQWENIKKFSNNSNIEGYINKQKMAISEVEKKVDDIVKYFAYSLETRLSELITLARRSKEKGERVRKDLERLINRMNRLKGEKFSSLVEEQTKTADELRKDAVSRSEYETDANELFTNEFRTINNKVNSLLNDLQHSAFDPEISGLLSPKYYETRLNRLKTRETEFNATLITAENQRRVLLDEISNLNRQIMENGRLIEQLKKQVGESDDIKT